MGYTNTVYVGLYLEVDKVNEQGEPVRWEELPSYEVDRFVNPEYPSHKDMTIWIPNTSKYSVVNEYDDDSFSLTLEDIAFNTMKHTFIEEHGEYIGELIPHLLYNIRFGIVYYSS